MPAFYFKAPTPGFPGQTRPSDLFENEDEPGKCDICSKVGEHITASCPYRRRFTKDLPIPSGWHILCCNCGETFSGNCCGTAYGRAIPKDCLICLTKCIHSTTEFPRSYRVKCNAPSSEFLSLLPPVLTGSDTGAHGNTGSETEEPKVAPPALTGSDTSAPGNLVVPKNKPNPGSETEEPKDGNANSLEDPDVKPRSHEEVNAIYKSSRHALVSGSQECLVLQ